MIFNLSKSNRDVITASDFGAKLKQKSNYIKNVMDMHINFM